MKRQNTRLLATTLALAGLLPLAAGCASMSRKEKGAAIGAGAGAAVGAAVGKATGSTARGAIIGAAVGGAAGAIIGHQMDQQAKELAYSLPGAKIERVGEGIQVTFPEGLLFPYDSDQLMPAARDNLRKFAESLAKYPRTSVMIVGHTDAKGTDAYNQALSQKRSASAAAFLSAQGVDRNRLSTVGRGESEPIASNDTDAGRQQNRRVEVAIYANEAARRGAQSGR
jgi:outer membrane protein OmpA-like peptidoglycan-associated protein